MPRPNYANAVAWIGANDEPSFCSLEDDIETVATMISVALVADLWGYRPERVARDVINWRIKDGCHA